MSTSKRLYTRAQENLEFPEVLAYLADLTKSTDGSVMALALQPTADLEEAKARQEETADTLAVINSRNNLPINGFPDVKNSIKKVKISGAVLSIEELYYLAQFLSITNELVQSNPDENSDYYIADNIFYETVEELQSSPQLSKKLRSSIISPTEISDSASANLREIRRNITRAQNQVRRHLEKLVKNLGESLQDQLVTLRRGRYVLPVKAENKRKVPGIVHDTSNSGQTLFIEPLAVVDENNRISELRAEEEREIHLILESLSSQVRANVDDLQNNIKLMSRLDFMQAKARLALNMKANKPHLNNKGHIDLKQARHPHIDAKKVVPIDISLGKDYRSLLITGPNTGGKSVSLKTTGLLSIMAMSGLHVPAKESSELSVFENVFTDIGDEQSIAEDLSTFSAHMKTLVEITENVNENTLVLVDELGSGTDPSEGAALAIAVIDYLLETNSVTLVTTHYKELKIYALETKGIENASMEFDEASLQPTYKVITGIPGTSHAFSIARRMGLNSEIIYRAESELSEEELKLEKVLKEIEETRFELERRSADLERSQIQLENEVRKNENERIRLETARQDLARDGRNAKHSELQRQSQVVDSLIDELEAKIRGGQSVNMDDAKALRSMLRSELRDVEEEIGASTLDRLHVKTGESKQLTVGDDAYSPSLNLEGTIITEPDSKGQVQFRTGQLTVSLPLASLAKPRSSGKSQESARPTSSARRNSARTRARSNFTHELMLRGERVEEALHILDNYLDDAILANAETVRVIHGKGTGALKKAVHEFLRKDRRAAKYELAEFGEGDAGVTIVSLRG